MIERAEAEGNNKQLSSILADRASAFIVAHKFDSKVCKVVIAWSKIDHLDAFPGGMIRAYTTDYDADTSVKWIKTLLNNVVSNYCRVGHQLRITYDTMTCFYLEGTVSFVPLIMLTMWLSVNTEFYGGYSTWNDANTSGYDTVSIKVTNHSGWVTVNARLRSTREKPSAIFRNGKLWTYQVP